MGRPKNTKPARIQIESGMVIKLDSGVPLGERYCWRPADVTAGTTIRGNDGIYECKEGIEYIMLSCPYFDYDRGFCTNYLETDGRYGYRYTKPNISRKNKQQHCGTKRCLKENPKNVKGKQTKTKGKEN